MATKRKRYLDNAGLHDFYSPVLSSELPELIVTPYGKISYASSKNDGASGTRFLTRDEWLRRNSKTSTASSRAGVSVQYIPENLEEVAPTLDRTPNLINTINAPFNSDAKSRVIRNDFKCGGRVKSKTGRSLRTIGQYDPKTQRQIINDYSKYKAQEVERKNADDINKLNIFAIPAVLARTAKYRYGTNITNPDYNTVLGYEDWLIKNGYRKRPVLTFRGTGGGGSW